MREELRDFVTMFRMSHASNLKALADVGRAMLQWRHSPNPFIFNVLRDLVIRHGIKK
jgi:hypothetical protein